MVRAAVLCSAAPAPGSGYTFADHVVVPPREHSPRGQGCRVFLLIVASSRPSA